MAVPLDAMKTAPNAFGDRHRGDHASKPLSPEVRFRADAHFAPLPAFKKIAGTILRQLRASQKAPGKKRIYTAGEKEHDVWLDRKDKGVPVGDAVQKEFIAIRDKKNLPYKFPFEQ